MIGSTTGLSLSLRIQINKAPVVLLILLTYLPFLFASRVSGCLLGRLPGRLPGWLSLQGSRVKLVVNMIMGTMMSAFSEGMALTDALDIPQDQLLQVYGVSLSVCVCKCMYACTYVCMYACMYVCMCRERGRGLEVGRNGSCPTGFLH